MATTTQARFEVVPWHGQFVVIDHNNLSLADDEPISAAGAGKWCWKTEGEAAAVCARLNAEKGGPDRW